VLVVTNFITSFRVLTELDSIQGRILPAEPTLVEALEHAPDSSRLSCAISGDAIYQWIDQAAPGWAVQRTTPSGKQDYEWHVQAAILARGAGLKEGTPAFDKFVEDDYQGRLDKLVRIERPIVRRTIDRYVGDLRGLFGSVGFYIGEKDGVELGLRIKLAGSPE
jgi:hypothetical protein